MLMLHYYVDTEKAAIKADEWGREITITEPTIKNTGMWGDAGIDLFAAYRFVVPQNEMVIAETFIGVLMNPGVAGFLCPRGGDNFLLGAGLIDTGYTGTIKCKIINPYRYSLIFNIGDSVGQLVLFQKAYHEAPLLNKVSKVLIPTETERGQNGRIVNQLNL